MIKKLRLNSDWIGAAASGICLVHCVVTPFLFVVHAGAHYHHQHGTSPFWWGWIDAVFLVISLLAVYWSIKHASKRWVKLALLSAWFSLAAVVINEKLALFVLAEEWIYLPSILLVVLHLLNLKHSAHSASTSAN